MLEGEPQKDELNPYPWYDILCGTCYSVIATVQIVPENKPLEPSKPSWSLEQPHQVLDDVLHDPSEDEDGSGDS
jgi:hypothetical protein